MTVPASIEKLLKKNNIPYSLAHMPSASVVRTETGNIGNLISEKHKQQAHAHLLKNRAQQKLLAITPNHSILDLKMIEQVLGEAYTPVTGDALRSFANHLGLESMAAMPRLDNLPTIVDHQLLKKSRVWLHVGLGNQHIELERASFEKLMASTQTGDIAVALETLNRQIPEALDVQQIRDSVCQFTERRLQKRLQDVLDIPPLSATAKKVIQLRNDPNADVSDLCDAIELDPALGAQVVGWASSPYYSAPGSVKSIHDAIVRVLGFNMVMSLTLGLSLGRTLKLPDYRPDGYLSYWQQAIYVATCTEAVIHCMPQESRPGYGNAYLAGLLHNFGYLVIAEVFSGQFKHICQHMDANPHSNPQAIEKHIIGVSRDQLAAWLMMFWNLPGEVCAALRHQSDPDYEGNHANYAQLIYLCKKLLNEKGIHTGVTDDPIPEALFARFQLSAAAAGEAVDVLLESDEVLEAMARQMGS